MAANPIQIMLGQGENGKTLQAYYEEACDRAQTLTQNLAPYDETIDKANEAIIKVDEELNALYERAASLEQQRDELAGVINDADGTRQKIFKSHGQSMLDFNQKFFDKIADEYNTPALKDTSKSWDIDLNYMPTFQVMFITEITESPTESIASDNDDGLSDWMNSVNK